MSAPELGYDDYAGLDVKEKFILCFRGTPDAADKRFEHHDEHRTRMKTALARGALGILYIYPEPLSNPNGDWLKGFTPAIISEKTTDRLFSEKKLTCSELKKDLTASKRPHSFPLRSLIRYSVSSRHFPDATGYNVVGFVEGSDPVLRKTCLVYGAHFDHNGLHLGLLFPGADDNASGSSVVMALARAYSQSSVKPKRSVAFVLFGGEEMGLVGSNRFASHVPAFLGDIDAMFNFDMVGEGDGALCAASAEPAFLKDAIEEADRIVKILRRVAVIRGVGVRSSDFAPFFTKGIPCANFVSNGPHLFYHQTGDIIYRINPDIMADIARLAFLAGYIWADR